jgi:hypothetical protein
VGPNTLGDRNRVGVQLAWAAVLVAVVVVLYLVIQESVL